MLDHRTKCSDYDIVQSQTQLNYSRGSGIICACRTARNAGWRGRTVAITGVLLLVIVCCTDNKHSYHVDETQGILG